MTLSTTHLSGTWRRPRIIAAVGLLLWSACLPATSARGQGRFADAVVSFELGANGGFGADLLPDIVLGPPHGGGPTQGSLHVLALGIGGSIVLGFALPPICDGPGTDFTVFENAFRIGSPSGPLFNEYAFIAVSQNGVDFVEFPYDAESGAGLAGHTPVLSHPDNGISPFDPSLSGGDAFDLADVGLAWASYVRITDVGGTIADVGDLPQFTVAPNAGFDLDAVAALHACDPTATVSATPTATPTATAATAMPTPTSTPDPVESPMAATPTPSPAAQATATASLPPFVVGDLDGDGERTAADSIWLIAEVFDGDGDSLAAAAGGAIASGPAADVNGDGRISVADVTALTRLRSQ